VHALAELQGRAEGMVEGTVVLEGLEQSAAMYTIIWFEP
jgi:hypothetical protein